MCNMSKSLCKWHSNSGLDVWEQISCKLFKNKSLNKPKMSHMPKHSAGFWPHKNWLHKMSWISRWLKVTNSHFLCQSQMQTHSHRQMPNRTCNLSRTNTWRISIYSRRYTKYHELNSTRMLPMPWKFGPTNDSSSLCFQYPLCHGHATIRDTRTTLPSSQPEKPGPTRKQQKRRRNIQ